MLSSRKILFCGELVWLSIRCSNLVETIKTDRVENAPNQMHNGHTQKKDLLNAADLREHKDCRAQSWLSVDIITLNMELRFVGNNVFVANNNPCVRYYLSMKRKDSERVIIWLCRISSWRADSSSEWCTLAAMIRVYLHKLCILIKLWSINSTLKCFAASQLTVRNTKGVFELKSV